MREGISGSGLVSAVVEEWEQVVKKVAKAEVGEKVVVCGRAVRWCDDEIKRKIEHRREAYKKILEGQDNLWEEYYSKLRREVKNLVVQKKLEVCNEVVERANSDFEGNRKEFWAFVGRRTKGKRRGITALRNSAGVSGTSTKGKLEVLKRHYQQLGTCSVDTAFDDSWKEEVDKKVCEFSNLPTVCVENVEIDLEEITIVC